VIPRRLDYWRRVACKPLCFFAFGLGAFAIGALAYPAILIAVRGLPAQRRVVRRMIRSSFSLLVGFTGFLGLVKVEFENAEALRNSRGLIIAANHPSLIDVVILASLIPLADCIVKRSLWDTPFVRHIVRRAYIPNSIGFEATVGLCGASLAEGNTLIVFPEGTRTREGEASRLRRGAARIALATGRDILPVRIETPDARGLRKGDPFFSFPEDGPIRYRVRALTPIRVGEYAGMQPAIAARALTKRLSDDICSDSATEPLDG
jgi:1-acyl-sn-glycerol-3-phosphate acyltransferase